MTEPTLAELIAASGLPRDASLYDLMRDHGLRHYTANPLLSEGLQTLADLTDLTDEALLDVDQFGPRRLADLKAAVLAAGTEAP